MLGAGDPPGLPRHPREGDTSVAGRSVWSWGGLRHQRLFGEEEEGT